MIFMLLIMFLPVIGLPVFWVLPIGQAAPIYLVGLLLFAGMMWLMRGAMKRPRMTGAECLVGKTAEVVARSTLGYGPQFVVRVFGELWSARCDDALQRGDSVVIVSVQGNCVVVARRSVQPEQRRQPGRQRGTERHHG
ncbi:MAG: NfeD family protein [Gemmatimonadota bacterium]